MGIRFSKSISLSKLFRVTISKGGFSASVGVPGYRKTISKKGVTTTWTLPRTGLSYRTYARQKAKPNPTIAKGPTLHRIRYFGVLTAVLACALIFWKFHGY
ncbi:DUF4236 domain-containing protein [Aestuariivirga sp.]|uniref:DUF4236 domain-containing protein n=1 Tax=Aestuariivirga sp. TaxID=2650926 RepID=UPI0039E3ED39